MIRKIIHINEEKCNGCGACANACHEGAIQMVDGKARLMRDDFCDGLGDCLPACPTNAITFEEREADAYDDDAVKAHLAAKGPEALKKHLDAKKHMLTIMMHQLHIMVDVRVLWLVKFNTLLLMVDVRVLWLVRLNTLIIMMQVLLIICQEVHRPLTPWEVSFVSGRSRSSLLR